MSTNIKRYHREGTTVQVAASKHSRLLFFDTTLDEHGYYKNDGTTLRYALTLGNTQSSIHSIGNLTFADDSWLGLSASKARIIFDDTPANDLISFQDGYVGIGGDIAAADTLLHVFAASAGTVTAVSGTVATFESDDSPGLSLLGHNTGNPFIAFGCPTSNIRGKFVFNNENGILSFTNLGVEQLRLRTTGLCLTDSGGTIVNPDTIIHAYKASAGTVSAANKSVIAAENSGDCTISILTPEASSAALAFGNPADNDEGMIYYIGNQDKMGFWVNGAATANCFMELFPGALTIPVEEDTVPADVKFRGEQICFYTIFSDAKYYLCVKYMTVAGTYKTAQICELT